MVPKQMRRVPHFWPNLPRNGDFQRALGGGPRWRRWRIPSGSIIVTTGRSNGLKLPYRKSKVSQTKKIESRRSHFNARVEDSHFARRQQANAPHVAPCFEIRISLCCGVIAEHSVDVPAGGSSERRCRGGQSAAS